MRTLAANLVPFQAFRLKHPKPVWLNKEPGSSAGFNADVDQLLAEFAYATGSSLLPDSALDKQDSITVYAERYGGAGISKNGGGARCGNIGDWQVKGIGPNPLVGRTPEGVRDEKDDTWHSYGGLSLLDAIIETINTVVVNEALPAGAVNCIGIIETGDDTAYQPGLVLEDDLSTGRGALLVRETTLRPAHLCPSENFTPKDEYKSLLESDVYRLRLANRELARELNHDGFVNFLAAFLKTSATQFAVGKMLRIYHGAVNTANIVADGRWLDLSTVCFVEANKNYFLQVLNSGFYSEHLSPLAIAKDVAYQYSKFNNVEPLYDFYNNLYGALLSHHFATVLGISGSVDKEIRAADEYQRLLAAFLDLCFSDMKLIQHAPNNSDMPDVALDFVLNLFGAGANPSVGSASDLQSCVNSVLRRCHANGDNRLTLAAYAQHACIKVLVRAYFRPMFNRGKVQSGLESRLSNGGSEKLGDLIDSYRHFARWIFGSVPNDDGDVRSTVFWNETTKIECSGENCTYLLREQGEIVLEESAARMADKIAEMSDNDFSLNDFDCKSVVIDILKPLSRPAWN